MMGHWNLVLGRLLKFYRYLVCLVALHFDLSIGLKFAHGLQNAFVLYALLSAWL